MVWLFALCLLLPPLVAGQAPRGKRAPAKPKAPAAARFSIETLAVEGNRNYTTEQILDVAGLRTGQLAGKEEFEAARYRLLATGVFESVGCLFAPSSTGKGYAASFQVVEVAQVYPFRFERLNAPADQLTECLKRSDPLFAQKLPGTEQVLDRYARAIEACPAAKNIGDKVVGKVTIDDAGQMVISFRPATPPPSVAEVRFLGNKVIPATTLQNTIAGLAIGSVYAENRFRQLLDSSIRPLYEARGRIRVAFPSVQAEKSQQVQGVIVTVAVAEGETFQLGEVRFEGEGLPEKDLRKAGDFKSGDVANFTEIQAGLERIKQRLRRSGHMKPETRVERDVHDDKKTLDLIVHVTKGLRYTFGTLKIQGLDMNGEAAVKRLWTMKSGAPFDSSYPEYFLQRMKEDGVFDNLRDTKSAVTVDDRNLTADVTLVFK